MEEREACWLNHKVTKAVRTPPTSKTRVHPCLPVIKPVSDSHFLYDNENVNEKINIFSNTEVKFVICFRYLPFSVSCANKKSLWTPQSTGC